MNQLFNKTYHKLEAEKSKEEILMIQIFLLLQANQRLKIPNQMINKIALAQRTVRKILEVNKKNSLQKLSQPPKDKELEPNKKKFRIKLSMIIFILLVKNN